MGTLVRNWFLKHFKTITKLVETLEKHAEIKSSSKIENSSKLKGFIIDAGHGPKYAFGMYTFEAYVEPSRISSMELCCENN